MEAIFEALLDLFNKVYGFVLIIVVIVVPVLVILAWTGIWHAWTEIWKLVF